MSNNLSGPVRQDIESVMSEFAKQNQDAVNAINSRNTKSKADPNLFNTVYQMNLAKPVEQKWYAGATPTYKESLGQAWNIYQLDPAKGNQIIDQLHREQNDPTNPFYQPYLNPTNPAVANLAKYGIDTSNIDDEWFEKYSWLTQYYTYGGTTNTPTKPGKKATPAQNAAYEYWQLWQARPATNAMDTEWKAMQEQLKYWAGRTDMNLSDDEIVSMVKGDMQKKYPTLNKIYQAQLQQQETRNSQGGRIELNRGTDFSEDNMYGVLWAARNKDMGSAEMNTICSAAKLGNQWQENPEIAEKLKRSSDKYNPNAVGMTLNEAGLYFGRSSFDQKWVDDNRWMRDSQDETQREMYNAVAESENITQSAEKEAAAMNAYIDKLIRDKGGKLKAEDIINKLETEYNNGEYSTLQKMNKALEKSIADGSDPLGLTRAVDFKYTEVQEMLRQKATEEYNKVHALDIAMEHAAGKATDFILHNDWGKTINDAVNWLSDQAQAILDNRVRNVQQPEEGTTAPEQGTVAPAAPEATVEEPKTFTLKQDEGKTFDTDIGKEGVRNLRNGWKVQDAVKDGASVQSPLDAAQARIAQAKDEKAAAAAAACEPAMNARERNVAAGYSSMSIIASNAISDSVFNMVHKAGQAVVDQSGTDIISDYIVNGLTVYPSIDRFERTQDNARNLKAREDELVAELGDKAYIGNDKKSRQTLVQIDGKTYRVTVRDEAPSTIVGNNYYGQDVDNVGYIESIEDISSGTEPYMLSTNLDAPDWEYLNNDSREWINVESSPEVQEFIKKRQAAQGMVRTEEEEAKAKELQQVRMDLEDAEDYLRQNKEAYEHDMEIANDAMRQMNNLESIILDAGGDLSEVYEGQIIIRALADFSDYEATQWTEYNPSSQYATRIQNGEDLNVVMQDAAAEYAEMKEQLADIDFMWKWCTDRGIILPDSYKENIDRAIKKIGRDMKDYEFFVTQFSPDFQEKAEEGEKILQDEWRNKKNPRLDGRWQLPGQIESAFNSLDDVLSDTEKDIYRYLYALDKENGTNRAEEYASFMRDRTYGVLNVRKAYKIQKSAGELTNINLFGFGVANALAVFSSPLNAVANAWDAVDRIFTGRERNPYSPFRHGNIFKNTVREESAKVIESEANKLFGEGTTAAKVANTVAQGAYEIMTMRADSAVNAMTFGWIFGGGAGAGAAVEGGSKLMNFLTQVAQAAPMGISAANDAAAQAKIKGASDTQALLIAAGTFAAETITEGIEIGHITSAFRNAKEAGTDAIKDFLKEWLTDNGVSEMFGETLTEIFEKHMDQWVLDDNEHKALVNSYRLNLQVSKEEAEAMALRDEMGDYLRTAIISYLSPGMDILQTYGGRQQYYRSLARDINDNSITRVTARDVRKGEKAYRKEQKAKEQARIEAEQEAKRNGTTEELPPINLGALEGQNQTEAEPAAQAEPAAPAAEPAATQADTEADRTQLDTALGIAQQKAAASYANSANIAKQKALEFLANNKVLTAAQSMERTGADAAVTSVLDIARTSESGDVARATTAGMHTLMEEAGMVDAPAALLQEALEGAQLAGIDPSLIRSGMTSAALGGEQSAARQVIMSNEYHQANAEGKASMLAQAATADVWNEAVQQEISKAVHENRVAEAECALMAEGAGDAVIDLENQVRALAAETKAANQALETQQGVEAAANEAADRATQEMLANPGDVNTARAQEGAVNQQVHEAAVTDERQQAVENAQQREQEGQQKLDQTRNDTMTTVREQAEQMASQKEQQQADEKAQEEEKTQYKQALVDNGIITVPTEDSSELFATKEELDARDRAHFGYDENSEEVHFFGDVDEIMAQKLTDAGFQKETVTNPDTGETSDIYVSDRSTVSVDTLKGLNDFVNARNDEQTGKAQEDSDLAKINAQIEKLNLKGAQAEQLRQKLTDFYKSVKTGNYDTSKLLSDSEAMIAINDMSRRLGVQIEIGKLPEGKDGVFRNGKIVLSDRLTVGQAMLETSFHEITHWLKGTKSYGKYKDTVFNILFSTPAQREQAVQDKIRFYADNGVDLSDGGRQDAREAAEDEILADFAKNDKTFANRQTIDRILDAGLGGKVRNALHNINQYLKNAKLEGEERVQAENLRKAERLYIKAINERRAINTHPSSEQFSVNQFAAAAGLFYNEVNITDDKGNLIATPGLYTADPSNPLNNAVRIEKVTADMIADTPVGQLTNAALALGTMNRETVGKVHQMFADLMTMCTKLQDTNLVWEVAGATLYSEFSAIKSNSDKQYSTTVDFGTICTKTQAVINQLSRDMLRLGRGLTSQEILEVYNDVYKADLKVPCPVCYVFSRWLGVPSLLENIRQYQNRFLGEEGQEVSLEETQRRVDEFIANAHNNEYNIDDKFIEAQAKAKQSALDKIERLKNGPKGIAATEAKIARYKDKMAVKPNGNTARYLASAEKALAKLQQDLQQAQVDYENADIAAYAKVINKKKADIEKSIKEKQIKIEGDDKGKRGINDDIRDAIREGKPIDKLEEKRKAIYGEIDELNKKLREVDAYNWVTQSLCRLDENGRFVVDDAFRRTKNEVLLDLNRTGEFAKDVKNWTYRCTRGAGMGKAILPYSGAQIGDSVLGTGARTMANPYESGDVQGAFNALKSAIIKAKRQNLIGGQRFQSTSDFRPEWGLDYIMTFIEQQAIGSNGQLYTKVKEFAPLAASVGIDTNCSIMPYANGWHDPAEGEIDAMTDVEKKSRVVTFKDEEGHERTVVLDFSDVTGMEYDAARDLSQNYDSVQMIMVGINDIHIRACLAGEEIDFVIPWHASGNTKSQLQSMMQTVNEKLTNSSDYTKVQSDQIADKKGLEAAHGKLERGESLTAYEKDLIHKEQMRDARQRLLTGATLTATDMERIGESKFLTSLYERFEGKTLDGMELPHNPDYWVELPGTETAERVKLTSSQAEQIFPHEYWDTSLTKDNADENGWRFVQYCQELGLVPRFSGGNQKDENTGKITRFGNFSGAVYDESGNIVGYDRERMAKGYWKTLIDRKMYDNNGNYRSQQKIDASKVRVGDLVQGENGRVHTDSNIPDSISGANYRGEEAEAKYRIADQALKDRLTEKAKLKGKEGEQARLDLERINAWETSKANDREQYKVTGEINPYQDLSAGEMMQLLTDSGVEYEEGFGEAKPEDINPNYTDSDGNPVTNEEVEASDVTTQYSIRKFAPPKKIITCYKAFYARDGKLYPPMVSNNTDQEDIKSVKNATSGTMRGLETPVGVWLDADVGGLALDENGEPIRTDKTKRLRVKNDKGGDTLAYRPGWHLGEWPDATQFNKKDPVTGKLKALMPDDLVFAECEIAADKDYQMEAFELGMTKNGKFDRSQAGLPRVPVDGYYKYRTNADPNMAPWYITGAMKITRILTDEECRAICAKYGVTPGERYSHHDIKLEDYGLKAGPVTPTENLERFEKNQASYDNDALLERALNDERYKDAYVRRALDFDNEKLRNEFRIDRISDEQYEAYREGYSEPEEQWSVNDNDASNMTDAEMLQLLQDAGVIDKKNTARRQEGNNPSMTAEGEGPQRQFGSQRAQNSDELDQQVLNWLAGHSAYTPDTNQQQVTRAINWIRSNKSTSDSDGYQESLQRVTGRNFNYRTADGQARMVAVMGMAVAKNDITAQIALADAFNRQGTDLGRALQARKIFRLMTPEGRISTLQKMLQETQEDLKRQGRNIDLKFSDWIYQAAAAATEEGDFDMVQDAAAAELANQIPANWRSRLRGWRMLSMLGNPRTHIRNVVGNALFIPAVSMKNKLGAVAEMISRQDERTKTLAPVLRKDVRQFAREDARAQQDRLTGEAKYKEGNRVRKQQRSFNSRFLQGLTEVNSNWLEKEDWFFLRGHYRRALGGWIQANGYTVEQLRNDENLLEKGRQYAIEEAQRATYRDFNKIAKQLNEISRNGGALGFVTDAVLPFRTTPANILRRGIEYSPVGLIRSLTADVIHLRQYLQNQNNTDNMPERAISPNQFIDRLCAGLTGTGIMVVGALLAGAGAVSTGLDDDDDEFEKLRGGQEYAVNPGKIVNHILRAKIFDEDVTFTMDWAVPMSMPFFVGAAIYEQIAKGGEVDIETVANAISGIAEPVFNLSMLDGVSSLLKTTQNAEENITQVGAKILANYMSSYVPSALGAATRTFFDDTRRKSFVESGKGGGVTGTFRYAWEQVENKLPGVSQTNIPVRDAFGYADQADFAERILENFVLPGYINQYKDDPVIDELERLGMAPKMPGKTFNANGEKLVLTAEQYDQLTVDRGQTAHKLIEDLMKTDTYKQSSDDGKAEMIADVWTYATQNANYNIDKGAKVDKWVLNSRPNPVQGIINRQKDRATSQYKEEKKHDAVVAVKAGDKIALETSIEKLKEVDVDISSIKTTVGNAFKDDYIRAYQAGDDYAMMEIEDTLLATGLGFGDTVKTGKNKGKNTFDLWIEEADKQTAVRDEE